MIKNQKGFSLVELLLVVLIIGIITTVSLPWLYRALSAARTRNAQASLRTVSSLQVGFYSKNQRFARLDELNAESNNTLGDVVGNRLVRGYFTLTMNPITPTDAELAQDYEILATKVNSTYDEPCVMSLTGSGIITEIFGTVCFENN